MNTEWISVKDRLPEPMQTVLVFEAHKQRGRIRETRISVDFRDSVGWYQLGVTVTHWMPLPDPPEVKS
jgi:phosphoribulokinase